MRRLARRSGRLQQALGAVMVVVAVLMFANLDIRFQNAIASDLPDFLVNPTGGLEDSKHVSSALDRARGGKTGTVATEGSGLEPKFKAPPIQGTQRWYNTPDGKPISLAEARRQGKVVLIDFWTYSCINCIRTLPQLKAWYRKYYKQGLIIIGVHTPEFPFEKDPNNVQDAIRQNGIRYPVVQDNDYATWNAYGNRYWPAKYIIDVNGNVRYVHYGEGGYKETETAIRTLLEEAGRSRLGGRSKADVETPLVNSTPETYLGSGRAERFVNGPIVNGRHKYSAGAKKPPADHLAYGGEWTIGTESATAGRGAKLLLNFRAKNVYLVLGSTGGPRKVQVLVDGKVVRTVTVRRQKLYTLVRLPQVGRHVLELRMQPGTQGYAFTFG
jgi:thiol-disulfide isomerase/thioredoxin